MGQSLEMTAAGIILGTVLIIFTLGKSPVFRLDRAGAAIVGAIFMIGTGVLSFDEAAQAVDYRTIVILFSMMIVVANLKLAGFFEFIGSSMLKIVRGKTGLLAAVILASGILSAVAINDIVCLLFTPVVLLLSRKAECNPVPNLLGLAMASNIGSAATLLGNPQNILVGNLSGMSFFSYFTTALPIAVIGLVLLFAVIFWYYQKDLRGQLKNADIAVNVHMYLIIKSLLVLFGVLLLYLFGYDLALTAGLGAAILLMTRRIKPNKVYASVDFNLLIIFIGLFIIVAGAHKSGIVSYALEQFSFVRVNSLAAFAALTVVLSNIVSNVPAVLLLRFLLPEGNADMWWKAMALFSTLAGNLTITGSIANLIVAEIAKRDGVTVWAGDYFRIGFPLTIALTWIGYLWLSII